MSQTILWRPRVLVYHHIPPCFLLTRYMPMHSRFNKFLLKYLKDTIATSFNSVSATFFMNLIIFPLREIPTTKKTHWNYCIIVRKCQNTTIDIVRTFPDSLEGSLVRCHCLWNGNDKSRFIRTWELLCYNIMLRTYINY